MTIAAAATAGGYAKQNVTSRTKAVAGANVNLT
jgi:hypothetical protein